ncbi:MAG TPA: DVU3141 family protein [Steroidobacteraceae bacterium]
MRVACAALLAFTACMGPASFGQANLGELRDAPSAKFTPQDFEMLWAAVDEVSRGAKTGVVKKWANAETGNGGAIKLLNVFTSTDGRDCRRLRMDNYAKTLKGSSKQIVCADPEGKWMMDADARPAPKP